MIEAIAGINGLMEQRHAAKHNGDMCFIVDTTQDFNLAESTVGRGCDLMLTGKYKLLISLIKR